MIAWVANRMVLVSLVFLTQIVMVVAAVKSITIGATIVTLGLLNSGLTRAAHGTIDHRVELGVGGYRRQEQGEPERHDSGRFHFW